MDETACQDGLPTSSNSQNLACLPYLEQSNLDKDTAIHDDREGKAAMAKSEKDLQVDDSATSGRTSPTIIDGDVDVEAARADTNSEKALAKPVKVRRSKRRGLLGRFTVLAEVEDPKKYSRATKWFITFIIGAAAVAAPMGSGILFPSLVEVSDDLHTTPTTTNLTVALYMLAMAIFPLWWSSFSETLGRRTIYISSYALFVILNIAAANSIDIAMLIVMRVLSGGAAASVQAVGAGTIADIWEPKERGTAMGYFYLGPLMGPLLAPIIGGVLSEKWGWRSTQWFLAIYGAVLLIFLIFAFPETLKVNRVALHVDLSATERRSTQDLNSSLAPSVHRKTKALFKVLNRLFIAPLKIILNLRFPAVLITVYYASITFGCLYVLNISIQSTFASAPYNFTTIQVGLAYLPGSLGYLTSSFLAGKWSDRIMAREAKRAKRRDADGQLIYRPEDRMRENAWLGAFLYPAAMLWYGWAAQRQLFWAIPLVANFFFGVGTMLIFNMATTMLTEFMPKKSSEGVATNNFIRNMFSAVGGVVAQPLITAMGNGWLFTMLGIIAAASSIIIWVMRHFGPRWRESMDAKLNR